jgi:hypothetical protein
VSDGFERVERGDVGGVVVVKNEQGFEKEKIEIECWSEGGFFFSFLSYLLSFFEVGNAYPGFSLFFDFS